MPVTALRLLTAALVAMASSSAGATWLTDSLRVNKPRELGYWLYVNSTCPVSEDSLKRTVEGVLTGKRLEPKEDHFSDTESFSLTVRVSCLELTRNDGERLGKYSYNTNVRFGRMIDGNDWIQNYNYGGLAFGDGPHLTEVLRDHTERAVTAYTRANLVSYSSAE